MTGRSAPAVSRRQPLDFVWPCLVLLFAGAWLRIDVDPARFVELDELVALVVVWLSSGDFRDAFGRATSPVGVREGDPGLFLQLVRTSGIDVVVGPLAQRVIWFGLASRDGEYFSSPYWGVLSRAERKDFLRAGALELPLIPTRAPEWRSIPKGLTAMPELVFALTFPALMALLRYFVAELPASHCAAFAGRMAVGMTIVFAISRYWYYARIATALAAKGGKRGP